MKRYFHAKESEAPEEPLLNGSSKKRYRQGRLTDCKKVVDLKSVRALQESIQNSYNTLIRLDVKLLNCSTEEESNNQGGESKETPLKDKPDHSRERAFEIQNLRTSLRELGKMYISLETLELTLLGKTVNAVAQRPCTFPSDIIELSTELVLKWRENAHESLTTRDKKLRDEKEGRIPVYKLVSSKRTHL